MYFRDLKNTWKFYSKKYIWNFNLVQFRKKYVCYLTLNENLYQTLFFHWICENDYHIWTTELLNLNYFFFTKLEVSKCIFKDRKIFLNIFLCKSNVITESLRFSFLWIWKKINKQKIKGCNLLNKFLKYIKFGRNISIVNIYLFIHN